MKIRVIDAATDLVREFEGTPDELIVKLDGCYSWLKRYSPKSLGDRIRLVAGHQIYFVKVEE